MKKAVMAMILLAGSALAGPRFAVGIGFGAPAPVAVVRPSCPGPGYVWVDGYYAASGVWAPGFWRAPAVAVAVGPRVVGPHYFAYDHERGRDVHRDFRR
jgi:hypothetical protein